MMYWTGSKEAIDAANAAATALVRALPALRGDVPVKNPLQRWAVPQQDATGAWVILAYPGMDTPEGCAAVEAVEWPEEG